MYAQGCFTISLNSSFKCRFDAAKIIKILKIIKKNTSNRSIICGARFAVLRVSLGKCRLGFPHEHSERLK